MADLEHAADRGDARVVLACPRSSLPPSAALHKNTPSFLDALAALRRTLWSQRITGLSSRPTTTAK